MKTRCLSSAWATHGFKTCQWGSLAFGIVLISACATPEQADNGSSALTPVAPIVARPDGSVRIDTESQEVASLWASAERARAENKLTISLELLYEALEIEPENGLLWSRAAELQLDSLEPAMAEDFATRSNNLAGQNRPLQHRNWMIIEHARSMRGDLLGVRSAHKQVQLFQNR